MLHPYTLDSLFQQLVQKPENDTVRGVYLTGSYARGAADAWNDLDLVFVTREGVPCGEELVHRADRLVRVVRLPLSHCTRSCQTPIPPLTPSHLPA